MSTQIAINNGVGKSLRTIERVEVISLVDSVIDMLTVIKRKDVHRIWDWVEDRERAGYPLAEHGFSMLIGTFSDSGYHTVLYDAGFDTHVIVENAKRTLVDLSSIEAIVLSHGHMDHTGGLLSILRAMDAKGMPVFVHRRMFLPRGWRDPEDPKAQMICPPPCPSQAEMEAAGATVIEAKGPYLLCDDTILITGEIPRKTSYEPGYPDEWVFEDGEWRLDPRVLDDRAIVMNVRGKGLVVVTGCGHSGVVNTVRYAQELTGIERVYAILGGCHMAGKYYEPNIPKTVKALVELAPALLVPSHCTGWLAQKALADALPTAFVPNSVGNMYRI
jgi:7,8-dihydropterin-6-yl-methyl-4-(beta-D-ribofuranosyl)aminobenzene 5'-phosphate synthase